MLYLNTNDLMKIGTDWKELIGAIYEGTEQLDKKDFSQPVKLYLRYNDLQNRIIAMPAYVGGALSCSGLKWIASFPRNIEKDIQRAHSVTVLNDTATGKPICIINSALISGLRTAAVTGMVLEEYLRKSKRKNLKVGINGFGPIGKLHLQMLLKAFGHSIEEIVVYDIIAAKSAEIPAEAKPMIKFGSCWKDAYSDADVFITCTVTKERYIDQPPKPGSLQLNISLRDYVPEFKKYVDLFIVDDWVEVCRENTDIEKMHLEQGLQKEDVHSISDVVAKGILHHADEKAVVMFNPMGMAVYDMCIAKYFFNSAINKKMGMQLED